MIARFNCSIDPSGHPTSGRLPGGSRTLITATATGCPGLMDYRAQANLAMGPDRSLMQNFQSGHLAVVVFGNERVNQRE